MRNKNNSKGESQMKKAIMVHCIVSRTITRQGVTYEGTESNDYNAEIIPGQSIRIFGEIKRYDGANTKFDRTFKMGEQAEYDSYNLIYTGEIIAIAGKTVTIQHYTSSHSRKSRMSLHDFIWRNWDLDMEKVNARNQDTLQHI